MTAYIIRRLLLIIPTLLAIMVINFMIIQAAPGGPVDQIIATIEGHGGANIQRVTGGGGDFNETGNKSNQARGLDEDYIAELNRQFGFDKPWPERFITMVIDYLQFDFGESYFRDQAVLEIIADKLPVSISLGIWSTLLIYLVSIPLGIAKAVRNGTKFDFLTSLIIVTGYAIPNFLFAVLLLILFAGGEYFSWFPLRGLTSENFDSLSLPMQIVDYIWHLILPITAIVIGGFATLTMLTRNSFLEEINKQYVQTARAKGCNDQMILYSHVFRNAMLVVIAGFPAAFLSMFFTSTLLIEVIFSLDGLGLLGFEAALNRDYPIMFASLYIFTLFGLLLGLITDLTYVVIDPRIDFERRND